MQTQIFILKKDFYFSFLDEQDEKELEVIASCECKHFYKCAWSNEKVQQLTNLHEDHPYSRNMSVMFKGQICNSKKRSVWCCNNGSHATESELKILSNYYKGTVILQSSLLLIFYGAIISMFFFQTTQQKYHL